MKITDIKSLPDLINYFGAKDKSGNGELTSKEISAYTISKYDISRDNVLLPWEVMMAVNRIQARPIFKYRDIAHLRQSKQSSFPLFLKLKSDTKIRGIKYKRGSVLIGKFGKVLFGVLASKTTIQGRNFPAETKLFFYLSGNIKAAKSPVNTVFKLAKQKITVKAGSLTQFYKENCRIKSATTAKLTSLKLPKSKYTFGAGIRLPFLDDSSNSLDVFVILGEYLAMLRHKSVDKQVKGLELIAYLADGAQFSKFIEIIGGQAWEDIASISKRIIKASKPPSWKLLFALKEALCALAGNELSPESLTAWAMLNKLIRVGLRKYPKKTFTMFRRTRVDLSLDNYKYITKVLLKHHDWKIRLAALNYILSKSGKHIRRKLLIKRLKVETNTKVLASIITSLSAFSGNKEVQKFRPRVKKLAQSASVNKVLKKAARQFSVAVEGTIKQEKARKIKEFKILLGYLTKLRQEHEKRFLRWRVNVGFAGGLMARPDDSFGTAGVSLGVHVSVSKGIWLSNNSNYMLSTSIELGYDPAIFHWKQGWYSLGANSSLRMNLSKLSSEENENWRLSVGPGFAIKFTPRTEADRKFDYGPTFSAGIFFGSKSEEQTRLYGPELRVTYWPKSKETSYLLSFKYMWGGKSSSQEY